MGTRGSMVPHTAAAAAAVWDRAEQVGMGAVEAAETDCQLVWDYREQQTLAEAGAAVRHRVALSLAATAAPAL